jgi:hypothetical protein
VLRSETLALEAVGASVAAQLGVSWSNPESAAQTQTSATATATTRGRGSGGGGGRGPPRGDPLGEHGTTIAHGLGVPFVSAAWGWGGIWYLMAYCYIYIAILLIAKINALLPSSIFHLAIICIYILHSITAVLWPLARLWPLASGIWPSRPWASGPEPEPNLHLLLHYSSCEHSVANAN